MSALVLYWAVFVLMGVLVVTGSVLRQRWLRRREQLIATTEAGVMGEGDAALGVVAFREPRGVADARRAPAEGVAPLMVERRRGGDRRHNRTDRRAQAQA